ncbi:hypothetical protein LRP30_31640 [Bradyrhizobium sp. C-145]|uniref:hypothetical protein n=1 Tax=Bradyrhizobium sp. C-145 TaxID=574727 RepID=UPI00201B5DEB|nr:hypothetical protein [Bradyrhizobium sp. C-145]UQR61437.1 hypothetical protein LRP30_31640 [Bradyrhizobium sp. C-145]
MLREPALPLCVTRFSWHQILPNCDANSSATQLLTPIALAGRPLAPLEVIAIIEAIAQLFLYDKFEGDEIAKARLRERLSVI